MYALTERILESQYHNITLLQIPFPNQLSLNISSQSKTTVSSSVVFATLN